eukprot:m.6171 g.6171  ORF g.6171 m.6171 type:complete len:424 (+) comp15130_c0_seq1:3-1274(+)
MAEQLESFLDNLEKSQLETLGSQLKQAENVVSLILSHLEEDAADPLSSRLYHSLYTCSKIRDDFGVRLFVLECIPPVIRNYLTASAEMNSGLKSRIEPCLMEIYNQEVIARDIVPGKKAFKIPTLAKPSVYHKLPRGKAGSSQLLTESALHSHNRKAVKVTPDSLEKVTKVTASNRMAIIAVILNCYRSAISTISVHSREALCHMITRLAISGFPQCLPLEYDPSLGPCRNPKVLPLNEHALKKAASRPRLIFPTQLLQEFTSLVYFSLYNEECAAALQSLHFLHKRADFDGIAELLLVTNAIINSMGLPDGKPGEGHLGIAIKTDKTLLHQQSAMFAGIDTPDEGAVAVPVRRVSSLPEIHVVEEEDVVEVEAAVADIKQQDEGIEMVSTAQVTISGVEKDADVNSGDLAAWTGGSDRETFV